jgi:hypothetical protein
MYILLAIPLLEYFYICSQLPLHPKEHPGINNIIFVPSYKENFSPKGCSVG